MLANKMIRLSTVMMILMKSNKFHKMINSLRSQKIMGTGTRLRKKKRVMVIRISQRKTMVTATDMKK